MHAITGQCSNRSMKLQLHALLIKYNRPTIRESKQYLIQYLKRRASYLNGPSRQDNMRTMQGLCGWTKDRRTVWKVRKKLKSNTFCIQCLDHFINLNEYSFMNRFHKQKYKLSLSDMTWRQDNYSHTNTFQYFFHYTIKM